MGRMSFSGVTITVLTGLGIYSSLVLANTTSTTQTPAHYSAAHPSASPVTPAQAAAPIVQAMAGGVVPASGTPVPSVTPSISPVATPVTLLKDDDKKKLLVEFKKAKASADRALKHQEQAQLKELASAQSMQSKQWREKEKKARRTFFNVHLSGPERRQYIQDYLNRKKEFDQSLKDAAVAKKKEWAEKQLQQKKLVDEQEVQFKKQLEQGVSPDAELWPRNP